MSAHLIEYACGTVLRGNDVDLAIEEARRRATSVHDTDLTVEQARSMARPA